jgi:ribosome-associated protein
LLKRKKSASGSKVAPSKSRREPPRAPANKPAKKMAKGKPTGKPAPRPAAGKASAAKAAPKRARPNPADSAAPVAPRPHKDNKRLQDAQAAGEAAIGAALDKKALVPVLIDVSGQATYTDFIAIVSGRSDRQVDAIADNVIDVMKQRGAYLLGREGTGNGRWTLLDFGDVVVHIFYHPVREFYDIESLWIDAPRISLKVPPEAMHVQEGALLYEQQ